METARALGNERLAATESTDSHGDTEARSLHGDSRQFSFLLYTFHILCGGIVGFDLRFPIF